MKNQSAYDCRQRQRIREEGEKRSQQDNDAHPRAHLCSETRTRFETLLVSTIKDVGARNVTLHGTRHQERSDSRKFAHDRFYDYRESNLAGETAVRLFALYFWHLTNKRAYSAT